MSNAMVLFCKECTQTRTCIWFGSRMIGEINKCNFTMMLYEKHLPSTTSHCNAFSNLRFKSIDNALTLRKRRCVMILRDPSSVFERLPHPRSISFLTHIFTRIQRCHISEPYVLAVAIKHMTLDIQTCRSPMYGISVGIWPWSSWLRSSDPINYEQGDSYQTQQRLILDLWPVCSSAYDLCIIQAPEGLLHGCRKDLLMFSLCVLALNCICHIVWCYFVFSVKRAPMSQQF